MSFMFQRCNLSACELSFDNVPVPVENVIGEIGGGFKVSSEASFICLHNGDSVIFVNMCCVSDRSP